MAKKKLILNENTTRRFMKLATIKPTYVSNFLTEAEEDEMEMEEPAAEEGEGLPEAEPMMDADMETEDEMEMEDEGGDDAEGMIEDFIRDAIMPWAKENGVALKMDDEEVEGDEEPAEDMMDMDAELEGGDTEMPDEEPMMDDEGEGNYGKMEEADDDLAAADVEVIDEDAVIAEVTKRVARRLLRESAKRK